MTVTNSATDDEAELLRQNYEAVMAYAADGSPLYDDPPAPGRCSALFSGRPGVHCAFEAGHGQEHYPEDLWLEMGVVEQDIVLRRLVPPVTLPRGGYRVRLFTDAIHGPEWLRLLATCAYMRGGILQATVPGA